MTTARFAGEVGPAEAGPVVAVGGRTQWDVGTVDPDALAAARPVSAPSGVMAVEAADMTVTLRATVHDTSCHPFG